jgi:para-nitrobenzyl esterase
MRQVLLAVAVLAGLVTATVPAAADPLVVRTDAGAVRGFTAGPVTRFDGIPYAEPPIGDLRWTSPRRPEPWSGVRDATAPGPRCAQAAGVASEPSYDEDCLYLNVTAPRAAKRKPVLVWIHGGGLVGGDGAFYDATRLAARGDVVVVTLNYRLGVFGFLSHPELGAAGGDFGLEDQTAALRWVQRNIRAFGGDPGNVTVAGESAGAFSTCALLASPRTVGLIDKAIVGSGTCSVYFPRNSVFPGLGEARLVASRAATEQIGVATAAQVGCATLECLRQVDVRTWVDSGLANSASQLSYGTRFLPVDPVGHAWPVPVIVGSTRNELRLFVAFAVQFGVPYDDASVQRLFDDTYGEDAEAVRARYPVEDGPHAAAVAWAQATTDQGFACRTLADARTYRGPVYAYEFADPDAPMVSGGPMVPDFPFGAYDGSELLSLFWEPPDNAEQQELARRWSSTGRGSPAPATRTVPACQPARGSTGAPCSHSRPARSARSTPTSNTSAASGSSTASPDPAREAGAAAPSRCRSGARP